MNFFSDFAQRLKSLDILEFAIILFALMIVTVVFTWPSDFYQVNNSFFSLSLIRISLLCLLALYYGSFSIDKTQREKRYDILAIVFLAIVTIPIEIAAYSLSVPTVPVYWTLVLAIIDSVAYFSVGLLVAQILHYLHLRFITILAVFGIFAAFVMLDINLGLALASPVHAISKPSISHLVVMLIVALIGIGSLIKNDSSQPEPN